MRTKNSIHSMKKMKSKLVYIALLSMVTLVNMSEAESADAIDQLKVVIEKARVIAKEKIQEWSNYFESEYAKWMSGQEAPAPISGPAPTLVSAPTPIPASPSVPDKIVQQAPPVSTKSNEQVQLEQTIKHIRQQVFEKKPTHVAKEGRAGTTAILKLRSGVPAFAFKSAKKIPRLDIGTESSIKKNDFLPTKEIVRLKLKAQIKQLLTPEKFSQKEIARWKNKKLPIIAKAKPPLQKSGFQLGQIVTLKKINAISLDMVQTKPLGDLKPVVEITTDDLNMMVALMIYEKGDKCHLASGLFTDLTDKHQYAEEANFYLGVCAHQMGFHSEAVSRLVKVIESENIDFLKTAITNLAEDLPIEYYRNVATVLKNLKNKTAIEAQAKDNVNHILARAAYESGQNSEAQIYSQQVSELSSHYTADRYLHGVSLYADKKMKEAEESLLKLREWMAKKNKSDKNIEALVAVNLGRMRFVQGRHQSALEEYMRIPKDHPLWVQGLIEQGWTQLNTDDPEGAVGNMYSLHSPYFKSIFMPESWVVRTIGYINICQYGDAYKTLSRLEQLHGNWLKSVEQYLASNKTPDLFYKTVKNYIKGKSDQNIDGLPYQVIREIARQRGFLNAQSILNLKEDEINQHNFIYGLVKKDQSDLAVKLNRTIQRLAKTNANIKKAKTNPALIKDLNEWQGSRRNDESLVLSYKFQTEIFEAARKGYLKLKASSLARIEKEKNKLRLVAGQELMSHLKDIQGRIRQIFEGNEFLRYEIFSGSGENIRFQVSGGVASDNSNRIPASMKPQKILNWEFDGEYWEDEIGSYRSSLKNNCPKNARTARAMSETNTNESKTKN